VGRAEAPVVLVVDDEADLREAICRMLDRSGLRTLAAGAVAPALALCRDDPGPVDLLLTDLELPGGSGAELAAAAGRARPGLRVLYMSGYGPVEAVRRGLVPAGVPVLAKPFTSAELVRAAGAALRRPG